MTPLFMWTAGKKNNIKSKNKKDHYGVAKSGRKEEREVLVGGAESYQPACYKHSLVKEIQ